MKLAIVSPADSRETIAAIVIDRYTSEPGPGGVVTYVNEIELPGGDRMTRIFESGVEDWGTDLRECIEALCFGAHDLANSLPIPAEMYEPIHAFLRTLDAKMAIAISCVRGLEECAGVHHPAVGEPKGAE